MRWFLLSWLLLAALAAADEPADVEFTLQPLETAPVALEKLDLDLDFRGTRRPGTATVHLDARLANDRPAAEEAQLMVVPTDGALQMRWEGSPQDSQSLAVPFPAGTSHIVSAAVTRLIFMSGESGHLMVDSRLRGLPRPNNVWEFHVRLPDRNFWRNLGPTVLMVRSTPWLEITRVGESPLKTLPPEAAGTLQGLEVSPFHPRKLHLQARWRGPRPELTVGLATTLSAWLGLLVTLPLARRLGRLGAFLAAGVATWGAGLGARELISHYGLLYWTTPAGGWEAAYTPLQITAAVVAAFLALVWAASDRKKIQPGERSAHA